MELFFCSTKSSFYLAGRALFVVRLRLRRRINFGADRLCRVEMLHLSGFSAHARLIAVRPFPPPPSPIHSFSSLLLLFLARMRYPSLSHIDGCFLVHTRQGYQNWLRWKILIVFVQLPTDMLLHIISSYIQSKCKRFSLSLFLSNSFLRRDARMHASENTIPLWQLHRWICNRV